MRVHDQPQKRAENRVEITGEVSWSGMSALHSVDMSSMLPWIIQLVLITSSNIFGKSTWAFPLNGTDSGCGDIMTAPNGTIKSPSYPARYPLNWVCVWTIAVPDIDSSINLNFKVFSLESHPQCRFDYVLVRDGESPMAPILGKFCGNSLPNNIRSSSNKLWIRFYSDSAVTGNGFVAHYNQLVGSMSNSFTGSPMPTSSVPCGGRVYGNSGEIESPILRNQHRSELRCEWLIENDNPYDVIHINFTRLSISKNQRCQFDYVMIEDTSSGNERILGRFCGTSLPRSRISGQVLKITYRTEELDGDYGFKLNWIKMGKSLRANESPECGGTAVSTTGFIRSSGYPENYQNNIECRWSISAPEDSMKIQLRMANFDLELSIDCTYDYMDIYDGRDSASTLIGRYCGRQIPDVIETTQKHMFIVFKTDASDTASGFEGLWVAVVNLYHQEAGSQRQSRYPGVCGGTFTTPNGTITTPNYPKKYPADIDCIWVIKADVKQHVKLTFLDFNIERHSYCKYDKITIKDGDSLDSDTITENCGGNLPREVISKEESLWIRFSSDSTKELSGFLAEWQFVSKAGQKGCGTIFKGESGELSSPEYPNPPKSRSFCSWTIEVPVNQRIELKFHEIKMTHSASCSNGYVQVHDGDSSHSPEMGRFCQDFTRPMMSSGNSLLIGYQPDNASVSSGFKLEWKAVIEQQNIVEPKVFPVTPCNSTLTENSGTIVLEKGIRSCNWLLKPSNGSEIVLSIIKANLLPNPDCNLERLFIRNGLTSTAPLLLSICNRIQGTSVTSTTRALRIEYELIGESNDQNVIIQWNTIKKSAEISSLAASCGFAKVPLPENSYTFATTGMLPWMAAIKSGSGVVYCGAAILTNKWLLTAAHCLKRYPFYAFRKITTGDLNLLKTEATEQSFDIKQLHIHPGYNSSTNENDIALINIEGQIGFNDNINPICLPRSETAIPSSCYTAGWGTRSFLGQPSNHLILGKIPVIPSNACNKTRVYKGKIKNGMICAGSRLGGIDTCQGDGGGPLVCKLAQDNNIVIGISSWGSGCGHPGRYGVYTDVRKYIKWIFTVIST